MTSEKAGDLSTSDVAGLLRVSQATVTRIGRDLLAYSTTPGGWRRYRLADVVAYAREHLGREIEPDDGS